MSIKIKTMKFTREDGLSFHVIEKIRALPESKLPIKYCAGYPAVWYIKDINEDGVMDKALIIKGVRILEIGDVIEHNYYMYLLKLIANAGKRLHDMKEFDRTERTYNTII